MTRTDDILSFLERQGTPLTEDVRDAVRILDESIVPEADADIDHVLSWLREKQQNYPAHIEEIPVRSIDGWVIDAASGNISHASGKFFSIIGVSVTGAGDREVLSWSQPMLKQEETSISGVVCQKKGGIMWYLFYAKFEPGNIDRVQISPALQVTASNLARAHQGKKPRLAEFFEEGGRGRVIRSVLDVEDGGRFFHKTNRTMIVEVDPDVVVPVTDDYIWLTRPQIRKLLLVDNVVNSLARDVCAVL